MVPRIAPRIRFLCAPIQHLRTSAPKRFNSSSPTPSPSPSPAGPEHPTGSGTFYKSFGYPILKCFLGALFTYQIAYFGWMKLETLEFKADTNGEIDALKEELKSALLQKKEMERELEGAKKVEEAREKGKGGKKGWW